MVIFSRQITFFFVSLFYSGNVPPNYDFIKVFKFRITLLDLSLHLLPIVNVIKFFLLRHCRYCKKT
jgi:hypothetical protein